MLNVHFDYVSIRSSFNYAFNTGRGKLFTFSIIDYSGRMITNKKNSIFFVTTKHTSRSEFFFFCCIGHGLISAHLSAHLVGNFLKTCFSFFSQIIQYLNRKLTKSHYSSATNFLWFVRELCVCILLLSSRMADVNNDVLVLGACIMDFIWFVFCVSYNVQSVAIISTLSFTYSIISKPIIQLITCSVFFTVMLNSCRELDKQLKERNLRLDMEVNVCLNGERCNVFVLWQF